MAGKTAPADGVVTGFGRIDGRFASVIAYDFTVMAGSMGRTAEVKCNRAREIAYGKRMPMIWLIDSAGARIQEAIGSRNFTGSGLVLGCFEVVDLRRTGPIDWMATGRRRRFRTGGMSGGAVGSPRRRSRRRSGA
jgi:hypothetical protein